MASGIGGHRWRRCPSNFIRSPSVRFWRAGVRLGQNASGALAYKMHVSHPGTHHVGVREILQVSSSPGNVVYPASINTDASPGYAAMSHRSAGLAFESCDAQRSLLASLQGEATGGHGGGTEESAQRANVGLTLRYHPPCVWVPRIPSRLAARDYAWRVGPEAAKVCRAHLRQR